MNPGKYSVIFADYEGTRLAGVDVVEYEFKEGINFVWQNDWKVELGNGDKVMLWYNLVDCEPVGSALTIK